MSVAASPADGRRPETRVPLVIAGRLHRDGGVAQDIAVTDLTPHGCGFTGAGRVAPGSHVTIVLTGTMIVAGRIAWAGDDAAGIEFCQALRPRALAQAIGGS